MRRTAVIFLDDLLLQKVDTDPNYKFDAKHFQAPDFAARPNSTQRLNISNFDAVRALAQDYPIDIYHYRDIHNNISAVIDYDQVVINTVASARTPSVATALLREAANRADPPALIFGTEYSWRAHVTKGDIDASLLDDVHMKHLLLRHTPRTDNFLYSDDKYRTARVQEFELAVDPSIMPRPHPIEDRGVILFVAGPEGRETKNNSEIFAIEAELKARGLGEEYSIRILTPPYTTTEYWEALRETQFLVFTSLGETFSYVLHDALAMGVIVLRRPELFAMSTDRFGVESYPGTGILYDSPESATESIAELSKSPGRLEAESERSKSIVARTFSPAALRSNWLRLLSGATLNSESLYVVDLFGDRNNTSKALEKATQLGCRFVMAYMSRGLDKDAFSAYAQHFYERDQTILPYCYLEHKGALRYTRRGLSAGRIVKKTSVDDVAAYFRLIVRTHNIQNIFVDTNIGDEQLAEALRSVVYLDGRDLLPPTIQAV